jgi:hypothetical protein
MMPTAEGLMSEKPSEKDSPSVVLIERAGNFFFYQPESGVIASGGTVEDAFEKFSQARRAHLDEVQRAGIAFHSEAPAGEGLAVRHDLAAELKLFLAKAVIVLLIVVGAGYAAVSGMAGAADKLVAAFAPLGSLSMVDVANKAEIIARDVQALSQERKETLRQSIAILSREAEPMVEAWRNPGPQSSPPANR